MVFSDRYSSQMDIYGGLFFTLFLPYILKFDTFVESEKAEIGTAGEQPIRNILDDCEKCQSKEFLGLL
jgi:hypothetical protein